jgi:hypothetical protein
LAGAGFSEPPGDAGEGGRIPATHAGVPWVSGPRCPSGTQYPAGRKVTPRRLQSRSFFRAEANPPNPGWPPHPPDPHRIDRRVARREENNPHGYPCTRCAGCCPSVASGASRGSPQTTNPWCLRGFLGMPEEGLDPRHADYDRARGAVARSSLIRISASPLRSGSMFAPAAAERPDADLGAQPMDF